MVLFDICSGTAQDDQPLRTVLRDQNCAFITNAAVRSHGAPDPAAFGAFPRILGHFSRDVGLFSLEHAVHHATSYPAERIGLRHIGRITEGYHADLLVFDPQTVGHQLATLHALRRGSKP
jgi:N-acyl-D-aspartate/D-glutamate deacylase